MGEVLLSRREPRNGVQWTAVAVATVVACLIGAGGAGAAITSSHVSAPADGTELLANEVTDPGTTMTVSGTTDGTTGDAVDIDCYNGGSVLTFHGAPVRYAGSGAGIPVAADGSFSVSVPLWAFGGYSCELLAVPDGTTPSPVTGFTGPRVAVSDLFTTSLNSGPNAGELYGFDFTDATLLGLAFDDSSGLCGVGGGLYDGSAAMNASPFLVYCADSLYGSTAVFQSATTPDLTRSEIQVDGQNAYNAYSAEALFPVAGVNPGFPALTATLNAFSPSTGAAQTTEIEDLARCSPNNVFDPSVGDCVSFVSSGVRLERVINFTGNGRIQRVTDTYSSTDGQAHALDIEYQTDLGHSAAGWELPGQSTFTSHATGDTAGAPASVPGTIYAIDTTGAPPSIANPVASLTFASPYTSITFDDTLWSAFSGPDGPEPEVSGLIDYQRSVPAGGSVSIQWTIATGASLGEVQGEAAAAEDAYAAPAIAIASPTAGATVKASPLTVTGTASAGSGVNAVTVNGVTATLSGGTFSASVPLTRGANTVTATATTNAGGAQSTSETVTYTGAAPAAATGAASQIGSSTAKLSGQVTAGGAAVSYSFQYGKTNRYGEETKARPLAAATHAVSVSAQLSRLSPRTSYHYRLLATGNAGTSDGTDRQFQTRFALKRLTAKVSPRRARGAPYRFTVTGSLTLPKGVTRAQGCHGAVTVLAARGAKKLSSHTAKVTKKCTYSATASFSGRQLKGHGTVSFTVIFDGNGKLGAVTAKAVKAAFR
jgi:Glucodextranase, domain B